MHIFAKYYFDFINIINYLMKQVYLNPQNHKADILKQFIY